MRETDVYPLEITSLFMLVERAKQQFGTDTCLIPTEAGLEPLSFNDLYDFTIKFADYLDERGVPVDAGEVTVAAQASGPVTRVAVREGDKVAAGDVIAEVDAGPAA